MFVRPAAAGDPLHATPAASNRRHNHIIGSAVLPTVAFAQDRDICSVARHRTDYAFARAKDLMNAELAQLQQEVSTKIER